MSIILKNHVELEYNSVFVSHTSVQFSRTFSSYYKGIYYKIAMPEGGGVVIGR